jgi:hypothetical protein
MKNQKLNRVTMNVSHKNPDAQVNFTAIGIGNDQKEAAIFALGSFLNIMNGTSEEGISDYNEALEMVNGQYSEAEIVSFMEKQLESNSGSFFNAYESTNVDYLWDEVEGEEAVGLIQEMKIIEEEY